MEDGHPYERDRVSFGLRTTERLTLPACRLAMFARHDTSPCRGVSPQESDFPDGFQRRVRIDVSEVRSGVVDCSVMSLPFRFCCCQNGGSSSGNVR